MNLPIHMISFGLLQFSVHILLCFKKDKGIWESLTIILLPCDNALVTTLLVLALHQKLRLERGGELVIGASCTIMVISRLIYKISRHMIHQKMSYFEAFRIM